MPTSAMTMPAIAGPMKRAQLKMTELIASAEASEARSTRLGISASRAGCARPLAIPSSITNANKSSTVIASVHTRTASSVAWAQPASWVMRMMPTRSRRSASTPASGLRNSTGRKSASETSPSQVPEWVSVQASQPTATRCSHQPISEMPLPVA